MKKNIIIAIFTFFMFGSVINFAQASSVMEPQWAEFCPPLYENAVFKPQKENSKKDMENNYWALRRAKFEKAVTECKVISKDSTELNACFMRVANLEKNKSAQRSEAKYERSVELNQKIRDGGYWWY